MLILWELLEVFLKTSVSKFLEYLKENNCYRKQFNNVAHATLLEPLSVMGNFLEVFQEFTKYSFQYKKHLLGFVYQAYKWHLCILVASFLWLWQKFSLTKIPGDKFFVTRWIKVKWRSWSIKCVYLPHFFCLPLCH